MKLLIFFVMLGLAMASSQQTSGYFGAGYKFLYKYESQITTGTGNQYSYQYFTANIELYFHTNTTATIWLHNIKIDWLIDVTAQLDIFKIPHNFQAVDSSLLDKLYYPFHFTYVNGIVESIIFHQNDTEFTKNIKRSVLNHFQVNLTSSTTDSTEYKSKPELNFSCKSQNPFLPDVEVCIINGLIVEHDFHYMVPMFYNKQLVCSLNIVKDDLLMGACHCMTKGTDATQYAVKVGKYVTKDGYPYKIIKRHTPKKWSGIDGSGYDLCLYRLASPIDFTSPVFKASAALVSLVPPENYKNFFVAGYGEVAPGVLPDRLLYTKAEFVDHETCQKEFDKHILIPKTACCARTMHLSGGGDSGSGLMQKTLDNKEKLYGVLNLVLVKEKKLIMFASTFDPELAEFLRKYGVGIE